MLALTSPGDSEVHIDRRIRPPSTSCNVSVPNNVKLNSRRGEANPLDAGKIVYGDFERFEIT